MMRKTTVLLIAFVTAGCTSLAAQSPDSSTKNDEDRDWRYFSSPVLPGAVRFSYRNTSDTSKCIRAEDFSRHPMRPLFRVKNTQTGAAQDYIGPLADRPVYFIEPGYVIVRPGQIAEATFDLSDNYDVADGQSYSVSYSLPVTECRALLAENLLVPTASDPFPPPREKSLTTWEEQLEIVQRRYPEWSRVGEFVELEQTVSIPASE